MDKTALTPNDLWEGAKTLTANPLVRSGLLGAGAYLGSGWLYDAITNRLARSSFDAIQDPYERQAALDEFERRRDRASPWVRGGATALAMSLPFLGKGRAVHEALQGLDLTSPGTWSHPLKKMWAVATRDNPFPAMRELDKTSMEGGLSGDLALGRNFVMPAVRPMSFLDERDIPKAQSLDLLRTQLPVLGLDNTMILSRGLGSAGDGRSGLISTSDIIKGLAGAGFGAAAGWAAGNVMGTIFAQPADVKARMANWGAIGGAILNSVPFLKSIT